MRRVSLATLAFACSCLPFADELARCRDAGRCPEAGGGNEAGDAGDDLELALWPVPPEAPSQYLVQGAVVLDQHTGLAWQQLSATATSWHDALAQCDNLNTLGYGGAFTGWRLPTVIELLSIIDSTAGPAAINSGAFPSTPAGAFWSASSPGADAGAAWEVGFDQGGTRLADVGQPGGVRCVRSAPRALPTPRFRVKADGGVVRDEVTGLSWQAGTAASAMSAADAQTSCAGLDLDGAAGPDGGWRLPAKKELETLVDRRRGGSTIDASPFPNTLEGYFWSATPVRQSTLGVPPPSATWGVDFSDGQTTSTPSAFLRRARCVR
jgi:Protein of unknown function (DUF1566)